MGTDSWGIPDPERGRRGWFGWRGCRCGRGGFPCAGNRQARQGHGNTREERAEAEREQAAVIDESEVCGTCCRIGRDLKVPSHEEKERGENAVHEREKRSGEEGKGKGALPPPHRPHPARQKHGDDKEGEYDPTAEGFDEGGERGWNLDFKGREEHRVDPLHEKRILASGGAGCRDACLADR